MQGFLDNHGNSIQTPEKFFYIIYAYFDINEINLKNERISL